MKKQRIKTLQLNKNSVSNFSTSTIYGGSGACRYESVRICPVADTDTCSANNVACNTGTGGGSGASANCTNNCGTQLQDTCGCVNPGGTSNLASPC